MKKLVSVAVLAVVSFAAQAKSSCGTHVRFIHGEAFRDAAVDVKVNGKIIERDLKFREASQYHLLRPGKKTIEFVDAQTGTVLDTKTFSAGANIGYSLFFAGPAKGPAGIRFGNMAPFLFVDDISPVANPARWKGTWFRMSETNVVIDLRVSKGGDFTKEVGRLKQKENRSSYQMGDFPAGTYSFNPVMPGSSEPFYNPALQPARFVDVKDLSIQGGENVDIIALGNFLGKAPNSLDLIAVKYTTTINDKGCYSINSVE